MAVVSYNGSRLRIGGNLFDVLCPVIIGGKTYPTVRMPDGKIWTTVNLDFKFTGLNVPTSPTGCSTDLQAVYIFYDETKYGWDGYKCGLLYNWYAVNYMQVNRATFFPGWHVPSYTEWYNMLMACGGVTDLTMEKLSAAHFSVTEDWPPLRWGNTEYANMYGFSALPGSMFEGSFPGGGDEGICSFWTSTEYNENELLAMCCVYDKYTVPYTRLTSNHKEYGFSVRLVKDP